MQCFSKELAKEVGVTEAIIMKYFQDAFKNDTESGLIKEHGGRLWYKVKKMKVYEDLPFLTVHTVFGALNRLIKAGYLETKNLNNELDRTMSYTILK